MLLAQTFVPHIRRTCYPWRCLYLLDKGVFVSINKQTIWNFLFSTIVLKIRTQDIVEHMFSRNIAGTGVFWVRVIQKGLLLVVPSNSISIYVRQSAKRIPRRLSHLHTTASKVSKLISWCLSHLYRTVSKMSKLISWRLSQIKCKYGLSCSLRCKGFFSEVIHREHFVNE